MYRYQAGLQLLSDQPLYPTYIIADNSDHAWDKAREHYKAKGFNKSELTTMVIFNEKKIS